VGKEVEVRGKAVQMALEGRLLRRGPQGAELKPPDEAAALPKPD
jgi:hypothetical protein